MIPAITVNADRFWRKLVVVPMIWLCELFIAKCLGSLLMISLGDGRRVIFGYVPGRRLDFGYGPISCNTRTINRPTVCCYRSTFVEKTFYLKYL